MDARDEPVKDPGGIPHIPHTPHPLPELRHEYEPIGGDYRLTVRTVLWVIVGLVFLGFAVWWSLT